MSGFRAWRRKWMPEVLVLLALVAVASLLLAGWPAAAEEGADVEPERLDVVHNRLARQLQTVDALLELVEKLETVADQPDAAVALLSVEGEPTERLQRALTEVARQRSRPVEMPTVPMVAAPAAEEHEKPSLEVVYAQAEPARVVLAVGGVHYAAGPGESVAAGDARVEIVAVRPAEDGGLEAVLRVDGGEAVARRPRR